MKILFAVDGSPQSLAALETLVKSFAYFRETPALTLLHVHPPVPYKGSCGNGRARRRSNATTTRKARRRSPARARR